MLYCIKILYFTKLLSTTEMRVNVCGIVVAKDCLCPTDRIAPVSGYSIWDWMWSMETEGYGSSLCNARRAAMPYIPTPNAISPATAKGVNFGPNVFSPLAAEIPHSIKPKTVSPISYFAILKSSLTSCFILISYLPLSKNFIVFWHFCVTGKQADIFSRRVFIK